MLRILQKFTYFLLCIILIYWIAMYLRFVDIALWVFHICMPLLLAFLFRFIMDPCIEYFHKYNRKIVCAIIYGTIIILFFGLLYVVVPGIVNHCMHVYKTYDFTKLDTYIHPFFKPIYDFLVSIQVFDILLRLLKTAANAIMYWSSNIVIAFGISFYLVFDDIKITRYIDNSTIPHKDKIIETLTQLKQTTFSFFKASFIDFIVFFVGSYVVFMWIGLDFVLYISLLLAATNLIPYIGPFIGGVPVIVYGFTISTSIGYVCVFAVLLLQLIESNFIQPMLFRKCLSTNPIILILALSVFGDWFGIVGMIIAPLILAYLQIIKKALKVENTN